MASPPVRGHQSFNLNIVVPTSLSNTTGGTPEGNGRNSRPSSGKMTPTRRGSGDASLPTGLASPVSEKGGKWKPFKKIRRLFSRSGHLSEVTPGEVPTSSGSVIRYTPGPDSISAAEQLMRRRASAPEPMRSSPTGTAQTFGEVTPSAVTSHSPPGSYHPAYGNPPTTSSPFLRTRQAAEGLQGGDQPVQLTVKLIKRLQDKNEDPLVNSRQVQLKKGKKGFGLVLGGSNPVLVLRIEPNGTADQAGVLVGDMIVAVNDIDVRRSTYSHVNQMITLASMTEAQLEESTGENMVPKATANAALPVEETEGTHPSSALPQAQKSNHPMKSLEGGKSSEGRFEHGQHSSLDENTSGDLTNKGKHPKVINNEPPARSNIILDLTAEDDFTVSSRTATPSSVKSFLSSNSSDAPPDAVATSCCQRAGLNLKESDPGERPQIVVTDKKATLEDDMQGTTETHMETSDGTSRKNEPGGFGDLIRKQSRIIRRQRHSVAVMEYSHLPLAADSEEDARILQLLKQHHSGLLTEAKDISERVRLDDKTIDYHDGDEEAVPQSPDGMHTPDSIASQRSSDDGLRSGSRSAPDSPSQQRPNKLSRRDSQKNSAVIIEHKSGRVLGTAPKARPSILPSEIAARVVETGRKNIHTDSGYVSMCQDEMNADLETALMSARIKIGNQMDDKTPTRSDGSLVDQIKVTAEKEAKKEEQPMARKVAKRRYSDSLAVPVDEPDSRSSTLPLRPQCKSDSRISPSSSVSEDTLAPPCPGGMRRVNSARIIQRAATKKEPGIAKEEKKSPPTSEDVPDWVKLAKNKAKRRSIHMEHSLEEALDGKTNSVPAPPPDIASKQPVTSPKQPITNTTPARQAVKSKALSASKASTLPRLTEENCKGLNEGEGKEKGAKRRLSFAPAQELCLVCKKPVYHSERFSAEGLVFHASCIKCTVCQRKLGLDKYVLLQQNIYCQVHAQEISMRLAPNIATGGSLAKMSVRGGALQ